MTTTRNTYKSVSIRAEDVRVGDIINTNGRWWVVSATRDLSSNPRASNYVEISYEDDTLNSTRSPDLCKRYDLVSVQEVIDR